MNPLDDSRMQTKQFIRTLEEEEFSEQNSLNVSHLSQKSNKKIDVRRSRKRPAKLAKLSGLRKTQDDIKSLSK